MDIHHVELDTLITAQVKVQSISKVKIVVLLCTFLLNVQGWVWKM